MKMEKKKNKVLHLQLRKVCTSPQIIKKPNVDKTLRLQDVRMLVNWSEHYDSTALLAACQ